MRKLRQFQELGHTAIFLIGSFTSLVGDPSDKDKARQIMDLNTIMENARTYTEQAFKILDRGGPKVTGGLWPTPSGGCHCTYIAGNRWRSEDEQEPG